MKNGCIIAGSILGSILLLVLLVVGVIFGSFYFFKREVSISMNDMMEAASKSMPAYVTVENLEAKYGDVIDSVESAADEATTLEAFERAVAGLGLPENVLYLEVEVSDEEERELLGRGDWYGRGHRLSGDVGVGTLKRVGGTDHAVIIEKDNSWSYMDSFQVWFVDTEFVAEEEEIGRSGARKSIWRSAMESARLD